MWLSAGVAGVVGFVACAMRMAELNKVYAGALEKEWTTYFTVLGMVYMFGIAAMLGCTVSVTGHFVRCVLRATLKAPCMLPQSSRTPKGALRRAGI